MKKLISIAIVCILVFSFAAMAETLKMGTNAAFQPYEYYDDESGAIIGIDAEVAALICEKLGYELEIVDMAFDSLIPALTSGKVDFVMAGMTVTEERKQSVDFSTSYAQGVQVVIVPEGSDITSIDDLTAEGASHKVGVQQGTTGDLYATWDIADAGLGSVEPYANGPDAVLALTSGKVDFVMAGLTVTPERASSVDFSASYAQGVQVVIVTEDSDITSIDDLTAEGANHKIGVQQGTTGDIYASSDIADAGYGSVEPFQAGTDAILALTTGKVDCVMIDNEPAKKFVAANEGLKILETPYTVEDYAIAFAKNSELTEKVNAALEELIADGSVQAVIDKYITAE